ncbi:hypothetical protein KY334_00300 [Candidatus Woesearchaeota archaeon]|nr:hypothetical protein [Candidatus Woesearchaeota archaeon]
MTYIDLNELRRTKLNLETYGKAFVITRNTLIAILVVLCIITPFTNWMIPFIGKIIKNGISFRFN